MDGLKAGIWVFVKITGRVKLVIVFSVITVCRNADKVIEKTLKSVLSQTETQFEYLIIDGQSTDGTLEILESCREAFNRKGIEYRIVSEKDSGIYHAMNKGSRLARGKWLLFLNAGDYFSSVNVMKNVCCSDFGDCDIVYGNAIYQLDTKRKLSKCIEARPLNELQNGMVFCHQCAFIKKDVLKEFPYDESFKIAGDYNFFYCCYTKKKKFKKINETIAVFVLGGVSARLTDCLDENERIRFTWGKISPKEYKKAKKKAKAVRIVYVLRDFLIRRIPKSLFEKMRERKYMRLGYREM